MSQLNDLASFVAVAETKGFAPAARRLGISTAGVSKSVIRLEERLKVRLFTRTTRKVVLTAEGASFYSRCRAILDDLSEAEGEMIEAAGSLKGRIRIDLPINYGERYVLPLLAAFKTEHPLVVLDIRLSDTITNLVEEGVDLALRFGELDDSRFLARKLGVCRLVTCAAPKYLERNGEPQTLEELSTRTCIGYRFQSSGKIFQWRFQQGGKLFEFAPTQVITIDDGNAHRKLGVLGAGLIQELDVNVATEIADGSLVECFKEYSTAAFPLSIIWPAGRHQSKRVRVLIEYLKLRLSW